MDGIDAKTLDGLDGLLVIGDDAFRLNLAERFSHVLDLGEYWTETTGLPFVFGLWAVRGDFAREHPGETEWFHKATLKSLELGLDSLDGSARFAAARSGVSEGTCRKYLDHIDYALGREQVAGLTRFFSMLAERGDVSPDIPLRFLEKKGARVCHA